MQDRFKLALCETFNPVFAAKQLVVLFTGVIWLLSIWLQPQGPAIIMKALAGTGYVIGAYSIVFAAVLAAEYVYLTPRRIIRAATIRAQSTIEQLQVFLDQGKHWVKVCEKPDLETYPGGRVKEWATSTQNYMREHLGEEYVSRFKDVSSEAKKPGVNWGDLPLLEHQRSLVHVACSNLNNIIEELIAGLPSNHPTSSRVY